MISLVSENGRWALRDGSMVFSNMVMQCERNETVFDHIVDDGIPTDRE